MTSEHLHSGRPHLFWPFGWSVSRSTVGCHRGLAIGWHQCIAATWLLNQFLFCWVPSGAGLTLSREHQPGWIEMEFKLSSVQMLDPQGHHWIYISRGRIALLGCQWKSVKINIFLPAICCLKRLKPIATAKPSSSKIMVFWSLKRPEWQSHWRNLRVFRVGSAADHRLPNAFQARRLHPHTGVPIRSEYQPAWVS